MLVQKQFKVELQQPVYKIIQCEIALENSLVLLALEKQKSSQCIIHYSQSAKVIHKYQFECHINHFVLLNSVQLIVPLVDRNELAVINLTLKNTQHFKYSFAMPNYDHLQIYVYTYSELICIRQNSDANKSHLLLTYFTFNHYSQHIVHYKSKQEEYSFSDRVKKGDNYSLVAWYKYKNKCFFEVSMSEVVFEQKQAKLRLRYIKIDPSIYGIQKYPLSASILWKINNKEILLIGTQFDVFEQMIYIANIEEGSVQQIMPKISTQDTIFFNINFLPDYAIIENFDCDLTTTGHMAYYLSYSQKRFDIIEILSTETDQTAKIFVSDQNKVVYMSYDKQYPKMIKFTIKMPMEIRQLYMLFLLHIEADFDDDLMQDTLELLNCI